jgi:hypothetical protein
MTDARDLTFKLGGEWRGFRGSAPCPVCQSERRRDQRALSIRIEGDQLLLFCHKTGCHFRDVLAAAGLPPEATAVDPVAAADLEQRRAAYDAEQRAKARDLWSRSKTINGTHGERYLRGRGITCALPPTLRWAPDCYHGPSARFISAMVADVSSGGVHRTFFEKGGARIGSNFKMMLGPCSGGAVVLSERSGPLVACEGIETGLSLLSGILTEPARVLACLSTSGLRGLCLPPQPGKLIIAADGDDPGKSAADVLAHNAYAQGWEVLLWPAPNGQDWNDVLRGDASA